MADLASLIARLKRDATIDVSEGFDDDDDLTVWIEDAIAQHRPDASVEDIENNEIELVILLAWAKCSLVRANKYAKDTNISGGQGFANDRSTPYYKLMDLANRLIQRYKMLVENLGIQDVGGDIIQGRFYKREDLIDALTPLSTAPIPSKITLSMEDGESATVGSTLIIKWRMKEINDFVSFYLFHLQSDTDSILQKWNYNSGSGFPGINDSAAQIWSTNDQSVKEIKLLDVDKSLKQRYVIVAKNMQAKTVNSNELLIGP
jgi:hypothetical protein